MEHIVQFAIGIDDQAIQKRILERGYEDVIKSLTLDAKNNLVSTRYASRVYGDIRVNWKLLIEENIKDFMQQNKDVIIELAAKKLSDSCRRSKKFRERMDQLWEEEK